MTEALTQVRGLILMKLLSVFAAAIVVVVMFTSVTVTGQQAEPPQARLPFPPDAITAYVDLQRIASESTAGMAANQQVEQLSQQKISELQARNGELEAAQQKLQQNSSVMSAEAQLQLQQEIQRLDLEIQRMTQDAEAEVAQLQQTLQLEFQSKLVPAINRVAAAKGLQFIFNAGEGGLIWADPSLDISADIIEDLNQNP
ncbi:MAG: hypothetical protein CL484_15975 [Acidobacteria bacterium]|nr:hypothetical protein [Acidobacteriota bacterium]|tara:strand:- start:19445 stop:20044 length:600 start_codon:yes stop_codon:yes gene_type:complete